MSINKVNKLLLLIALVSLKTYQAQDYCSPKAIPFKDGEEIIYDVEYKMGKSWVSAGKARFLVKDSVFNNQSCYYVEGKGKSLKNYDWFFKVRDKYASFISKSNSKPIHFIRRVREGEFYLDLDYDFDYNIEKAYIKEKKKDGAKKDTLSINSCSFDIMTSVYLSRAIDFNLLKVKDTVEIDIALDKKIFKDVAIVYEGKKIVTDQNGKKLNCIHFQLELIEGTIFKDNEKMDVFVSDDENKVPIYVETEIIVGAIRVYAKSIKGTKTPIKYLN